MNIEQLRELHRARPFRPFTLRLADGEKVHVPHPEFIWFPPNARRSVWVATADDAAKIVDPLLVAAVDVGDGRPGESRSSN
jgi:hypothetical protein